MSDFKISFYGDEIIKNLEKEGRQRMEKAVNQVRNTTLETLSGSRNGRQYRVPGTKTFYTASSPGQPPAVATGQLRQSISTAVVGEGKDVVGMVGTDQDYGPMLEYGTSKMAARPWLRKSFEKDEQNVRDILSDEYLKGMK
jgi:HK97 gp10 family phage protein